MENEYYAAKIYKAVNGKVPLIVHQKLYELDLFRMDFDGFLTDAIIEKLERDMGVIINIGE